MPPPPPPRTSPLSPPPSSPQRQDELQTISAPKEDTLHTTETLPGRSRR